MILIPIIAFIVYAVFNGRRTVKEACVKEVTTTSADASTKLIVMIIIALVLIAIVTGRAQL